VYSSDDQGDTWEIREGLPGTPVNTLELSSSGFLHAGTSSGVYRSVEPTFELSDSEILSVFYEATGGEQWTDDTNWLSEADVSDWNGVSFEDGHVTGLLLRENNLDGYLPAALGGLDSLRMLDLWNNHLRGAIPPELGKLSRLDTLELSVNELDGGLPPELGQLEKLRFFSVWGNHLTGGLPDAFSALDSLRLLQVGGNQLEGEIPGSFGSLSSLLYLQMSLSHFSGELPSELGNLTELRQIDVHGNQFTGGIPETYGQLTKLASLDVSSNPLSGTMPTALSNLAGLGSFYFTDTDLCTPATEEFQAWLSGIGDLKGNDCINVSTEAGPEIPVDVTLYGNYPNPFVNATTIGFSLPSVQHVRLDVTDALGRLVATVADDTYSAGYHEAVLDGQRLPAGTYFARLQHAQGTELETLVLVR
jgi:hypothetical protein